MISAANRTKTRSIGQEFGCNVVVAVAMGVLLGVLVSIPYDQLLGLDASLVTTLRCLASLLVFGGLARGASGAVSPARPEQEPVPVPAAAGRGRVSPRAVRCISFVRRRATGNLFEVLSVLRVVWVEKWGRLEWVRSTVWSDARS